MRETVYLFISCVVLFMKFVYGDYQLEFQLIHYENPTHRVMPPTEKCCDSDIGQTECIDPCDNIFDFCLSPPGQDNCSLGQLYTSTLFVADSSLSDDITFATGGNFIASGVRNPLIFTGYEWPGGFEMVVTVTDKDIDNVETVDVLVVTIPTGVRPSTEFTSSRVARGNAGRGFLRYNYRLTCLNGFTGDSCTVCDSEQCTESIILMEEVSCSCENGGECIPSVETESGFICDCPPQYEGSQCEIVSASTHTTIPATIPTTSLPTTPSQSPTSEGTDNINIDVEKGDVVATRVIVVLAVTTVMIITGISFTIIVILLFLKKKKRRYDWCIKGNARQKTVEIEEDLYDNPAYSNCSISQQPARPHGQEQNQQLGDQKWNSTEYSEPSIEVIYSQPMITSVREETLRDVEYQEPSSLSGTKSVTEFKKEKEGELEEEAYHKFINPLYISSSIN